MNPVTLREAIRLAERFPDEAIPLLPRQGRCEVPSGTVLCAAPARWWDANTFKCDEHKVSQKGVDTGRVTVR